MENRIHQYLDGELEREELSAEELKEVERFQSIVGEGSRLFHSTERPDLSARVMAQLAERPAVAGGAGHGRATRALEWLWKPRAIRVRPAMGILAAAAVLLFAIVPVWRVTPSPPGVIDNAIDAAVSGAVAGRVYVQFRLDAPDATGVRLAGSFTDWEPAYDLDQTAPGVWSVLVPLEPGVYDYSFVVDGSTWVPDPVAPAIDDGFGGLNSRLSILLPDESRQL